jgi:4'-phosphopantetheinyl transferase EntD
VLEEILPPPVVAEESFVDPPDVVLFPEEAAAVARAVAKRRNEFATARHCARAALSRLGVPAAPIVPGAHGAPGWPVGIVGSMTHCAGYRAAAVARREDVVSIGVDAEPHDVLPDLVIDAVAGAAELARLERLARAVPDVCWDRLLFSAKESVYKAWYPLTGRWLDFKEADVTVDAGASAFTARLLVPGPVVAGRECREFGGRFLVRHGLVITAVVLDHSTERMSVR